jgi:single-stranded DNA-binding protein
MNDVALIGNLATDPIYQVSERNQRGVIHFDMAVNWQRYYRDDGQYVDLPTVYHRVVAFSPLTNNARESGADHGVCG